MYQYGETVIKPTKEVARVVPGGELTPTKKTVVVTVRRNYAHSVTAQFPHGSLFLPFPPTALFGSFSASAFPKEQQCEPAGLDESCNGSS